jgi:hypothetical protein
MTFDRFCSVIRFHIVAQQFFQQWELFNPIVASHCFPAIEFNYADGRTDRRDHHIRWFSLMLGREEHIISSSLLFRMCIRMKE